MYDGDRVLPVSIVSKYDLLVTAIDALQTDAEVASTSTAIKSQIRDRAIKLANEVEGALKNEGAELRALANSQGV